MPAGDGIVEIGRATLTLEGEPQMEVKYVVYWRQEDGRWKWHVDIWNQNSEQARLPTSFQLQTNSRTETR